MNEIWGTERSKEHRTGMEQNSPSQPTSKGLLHEQEIIRPLGLQGLPQQLVGTHQNKNAEGRQHKPQRGRAFFFFF